MVTELYHHGIKGQKWGVRRYQNKDGSYTEEGIIRYRSYSRMRRSDKTSPKVQQIIDTMNADEKDRLGLHPSGKYLNREDSAAVAKRVLKEVGNKPVAFFDVLEDKDEKGNTFYNTVIGVSHDEQGKGYGKEVAKKGMDYIDRIMKRGDKVVWGVRQDNSASIHIAEKHGFKRKDEWDGWVNYEKVYK